MRAAYTAIFVLSLCAAVVPLNLYAQADPAHTKTRVNHLVEKKAEYHRLTNGKYDGYRIKIHFGIDREQAKAVKTKFSAEFPDFPIDEEYQQPHFVVLVGNFNTKLEAFAAWKKIKGAFPNAFIVKEKITAF